MVSAKVISSTTVFNIDDNQKCFLSSKSAYLNNFWRSCDTEDWSNDAGNTALHHRNTLHFKMYNPIENCYFKLQYFIILYIFLSSLCEYIYIYIYIYNTRHYLMFCIWVTTVSLFWVNRLCFIAFTQIVHYSYIILDDRKEQTTKHMVYCIP